MTLETKPAFSFLHLHQCFSDPAKTCLQWILENALSDFKANIRFSKNRSFATSHLRLLFERLDTHKEVIAKPV